MYAHFATNSLIQTVEVFVLRHCVAWHVCMFKTNSLIMIGPSQTNQAWLVMVAVSLPALLCSARCLAPAALACNQHRQ